MAEVETLAFGAAELGRVGDEGAIGHAEVRIGDSIIALFDARPGWPDRCNEGRRGDWVSEGRRC